MIKEITIRKAIESDLMVVFNIMCALERKTLTFDNFKEVFINNLNKENILYLVAVFDNKTIGFVGVHINELLHHGGSVAEIQELYVSGCSRNQGIGKKLVTEAEKICSLQGIKEIEVTSNKLNMSAHRFYATNSYDPSHLKFTKKLLP